MNLNEISSRVIAKIENKPENEVFLSLAAITMIASILSAIFTGLRLYCEWKRNQQKPEEQLVAICKNPGLRDRIRLRRMITNTGLVEHSNIPTLMEAVFAVGRESTAKEMAEIFSNTLETQEV